MSQPRCSYDCFAEAPDLIAYPDITGKGVVISYVATAGITVSIIIYYYFFAFQPGLDPFRHEDAAIDSSDTSTFKPNPIDTFVLHYRLRKANTVNNDNRKQARLRKSLIKCVLTMSDIQIVTGLSILISGYSQLHCGLSIYHWQILIYLAWFSSLTHLSCLTFLRNYLHNRPSERMWRLLVMLVIVVMLATGITLSGGVFKWQFWRDAPLSGSYALCVFRRRHEVPDSLFEIESFIAMITSTVLLSLGFLSRTAKLHKIFSIGVFGKVRHILSQKAHAELRFLYSWVNVQNTRWHIKRTLLYWPALSCFLFARVALDISCSMFFEVWWLVMSFVWGLVHLAIALTSVEGTTNNESNGDWSFGQVVPLVLLAAPLMSLVEHIFPDGAFDITLNAENSGSGLASGSGTNSNSSVPRTQTMEMVQAMQNPDTQDGPDHDYYSKTKWFKWIIIFQFILVFEFSCLIIILPSTGFSLYVDTGYSNPMLVFLPWTGTLFAILCGWPLLVLSLFLFTILLGEAETSEWVRHSVWGWHLVICMAWGLSSYAPYLRGFVCGLALSALVISYLVVCTFKWLSSPRS